MMNDRPDPEQPGSHEGLCATCRHARVIVSARGSRFILCERSTQEPDRFPRYPRLPVMECVGYERLDVG